MSYKNYLKSGEKLSKYARLRLRGSIVNEADELSSSECDTTDETSFEEVHENYGIVSEEYDSDKSEHEISDDEVNQIYDEYDFETDYEDISDESDKESIFSGHSNAVVVMILAFYLRHNLTWTALEHLLQLINSISPGAAPTTKYLFSKQLHTSQKPKYHYYCRSCSLYFGKKDEMIQKYGGSDIKCENCEYEFSLKKKHQCLKKSNKNPHESPQVSKKV